MVVPPELGAETPPVVAVLPLAPEAGRTGLLARDALRDAGSRRRARARRAEPQGAAARGRSPRARLAVILGEDELRAGARTSRSREHEDRRQALALDATGAALAETVPAILGADA
jgi:hypothetical protein